MLPDGRIPRNKHAAAASAEGDGEGAFLWAVSYADMLMVLMSFFVIYFQYGDDMPVSTRLPSSQQADQTETSASQQASLPVPAAANGQEDAPSSLLALATKIDPNVAKWAHSPDRKSLSIELKNNAYDVGSYELRGESLSEFMNVVRMIKDTEATDKVLMVVSITGHNDDIPIDMDRGPRVVTSNLVLAGLRATKAADVAVVLGLDPKRVKVEGRGTSDRITRSITLHVTVQDASQPTEVEP